MKDETFNFQFWRWNFLTDCFKQKTAFIINQTICNSRLMNDMKFSSYGNITFAPEDTGHRYPTITPLENFTRSKTNCLIYDLPVTLKNTGKYNKLFIYHSAGPHDGHYGFVMYNTETKKMMHKYFIEHKYDELCIQLNKSFQVLKKELIYNFFSKKYDSIQGKIKEDFGGIIDYETIIVPYKEETEL